MKKLFLLLFISIVFPLLLFSGGANERAYESYWKTLEKEFPLFLMAERDGIDGDGLKKAYSREFKSTTSQDDMLGLFERIASVYSVYDEIDVLRPLRTNVSGVSVKSTGNAYSSSVTFLPFFNAVVITIRSFEEEELEMERIAAELSKIRFVSDIIIDVRGCKRGENYSLDGLLSLFGGEWSYPYRAFFRNRETASLYYREDEIHTRFNRYALDVWVDVLFEKSYKSGKLPPAFLEARRWLLVDSKTSYSADFLASFAAATGWAVLVGENTYGNGCGVGRRVYTPDGNTGFSVVFNPCVIDNGRGGIKALAGVTPDVVINKGEDALEKCLEMIGKIGNDSRRR